MCQFKTRQRSALVLGVGMGMGAGQGHGEGSGALATLSPDSGNRLPRYVYFMKIHGAPYLTPELVGVYVKLL